MNSKKKNIIIAIMVAMFLAAFEGTVVTTAMPTIAGDLKGFELISWIFSAYLLTSAISTPIYGKLADLYGRKNIISTGISIFLAGSALCGVSQNMYQLIAFRAIQGLGAGAIMTVTYTIVGDVFELSERAKVQGWLSTVWGVSSIIGPFLGGFLIDNLSWHWIFFINIPFGILSILLIQRNLKERIHKNKHKIDFLGTLMLTLAILSLLMGVLTKENPKLRTAYLIAAAAFVAVFYVVEKGAPEPIIPFSIFNKNTTVINIIALLASGVLIGIQGYMPIYTQGVLGYGATISGLSMAPMSAAWITSSIILSRTIPKYGEKKVITAALAVLILSNALLWMLAVNSSIFFLVGIIFISGLGFGGSFTILTMAIQSSVGYRLRGAATATNSLVRTLGQTIAVTIFGSVLNSNITSYFTSLGFKTLDTDNLYSAANMSKGITIFQIKEAMFSGVHDIFFITLCLSVICLLLSSLLPKNIEEIEESLEQLH